MEEKQQVQSTQGPNEAEKLSSQKWLEKQVGRRGAYGEDFESERITDDDKIQMQPQRITADVALGVVMVSLFCHAQEGEEGWGLLSLSMFTAAYSGALK